MKEGGEPAPGEKREGRDDGAQDRDADGLASIGPGVRSPQVGAAFYFGHSQANAQPVRSA